ncbi:MAG: hypothetical protein JWN86_3937 [Planctomycetota bacterium]|nr:hypothetical protein [Planctomycetota bacterium]
MSVIKAAHLSVFRVLGYRYALKADGILVGRDILGRFSRENRDNPRDVVRTNAHSYFREWRHMVRPMVGSNIQVAGSISDHTFLTCMSSGDRIWGMIVFVGTASLTHAVLIPVFDDVDSVDTYLSFLDNDCEIVHVTTARFDRKEQSWHINPNRRRLLWTKTGVLYPEGV